MATAVSFHSDLAPRWEQKYARPYFRRRAEMLLALVAQFSPGSGKWLDAGCGAGVLSRRLAQQGHAVVGIDASPEMISAAKASTVEPRTAGRLQYQTVSTVERLEWDDDSFDGILCSSVLEYLDDPAGCLREFARVLRPHGSLVVSVPNRWSALRLTQKLCFATSGLLSACPRPEYLRYSRHDFSQAAFNRLLRSVGFQPQVVAQFDGHLPAWATKCLGGSLLLVAAQRRSSGIVLPVA